MEVFPEKKRTPKRVGPLLRVTFVYKSSSENVPFHETFLNISTNSKELSPS
jgi:hypothetical protein